MKYLLLISGLLLALVAAIFSVTGLSVLYGGSLMVVSLFVVLEAAKVSIAFAFHTIKVYKVPLTIAMVVLALVTSLGVFAGLNSSFQETAVKLDVARNKELVISNRLERVKNAQESNIDLLKQINEQIASARKALFDPAVSTWMQNGERMSVVDKRQRNVVQDQVKGLEAEKGKLDSLEKVYQDQVSTLEDSITTLKLSQTEFVEAGPLIFISETFDISLGQTSFYFSLLIVLVFDPMALLLVSLFHNWEDTKPVVTSTPDSSDPVASPSISPPVLSVISTPEPEVVLSDPPPPIPPPEFESEEYLDLRTELIPSQPAEEVVTEDDEAMVVDPEPSSQVQTNIYGDYLDLKLAKLMDRILDVPIENRQKFYELLQQGNAEGAEKLITL